jgi:hypothetical protein
MTVLLTGPALPRVETGAGEAAARRALRAQIARLEDEAAGQVASLAGVPNAAAIAPQPAPRAALRGGLTPAPRLLSLAELEAARDELQASIRARQLAATEPADRQDALRREREAILLDPAAHPFARVSNADVGEPGCGHWHAVPRFGLLGMLMRWWRVRISSGCP